MEKDRWKRRSIGLFLSPWSVNFPSIKILPIHQCSIQTWPLWCHLYCLVWLSWIFLFSELLSRFFPMTHFVLNGFLCAFWSCLSRIDCYLCKDQNDGFFTLVFPLRLAQSSHSKCLAQVRHFIKEQIPFDIHLFLHAIFLLIHRATLCSRSYFYFLMKKLRLMSQDLGKQIF